MINYLEKLIRENFRLGRMGPEAALHTIPPSISKTQKK